MTIPYDSLEGEGEEYRTEDIFPKPIPVRVMFNETEQVAPEFGSLMTYNIPLQGSGSPVQIATHRYHRYKCKFIVNIPAATFLYIAKIPDYLSSNALSNAFVVGNETTAVMGSGQIPDWEAQQPLYAVYTGTGPVSVSVMDMSYGTVQ